MYGHKFLTTIFFGAGGGGYDDNSRGTGHMQVLPGRHKGNETSDGDGGGEERRGTAGGGAIIIACKERIVVCDEGVICANGENQVNKKKGCGGIFISKQRRLLMKELIAQSVVETLILIAITMKIQKI